MTRLRTGVEPPPPDDDVDLNEAMTQAAEPVHTGFIAATVVWILYAIPPPQLLPPATALLSNTVMAASTVGVAEPLDTTEITSALSTLGVMLPGDVAVLAAPFCKSNAEDADPLNAAKYAAKYIPPELSDTIVTVCPEPTELGLQYHICALGEVWTVSGTHVLP
jgi:hypothetical protein